MTAPVDVALILVPPFIPEEPHLGLALLASYLRGNGFDVAVHDLAIRLFHECEAEDKRLWDRSSGTAIEWQHAEVREAFFKKYFHFFERYLDEVLAAKPKVIGFSCHITNSVISMEVINVARVKAPPETVIVAGGPAFFTNESDSTGVGYELCMYGHPTRGQQEYRDALETWVSRLDGVILDEGELPLLEVCQRARDGEPLTDLTNMVRCDGPGKYEPLRRGPPVRDLSTIPFPTFEEFDLSLYSRPQVPVLFNRGCIKKCTCCVERYRWGKFRARKAEDIVAELKHHVEVLGISWFNACDMLLNANVRELTKVCDLIVEQGLSIYWGGNVVVRKEMTPELFTKMRAAGCGWLIFGIEAGSPRIVELIGKNFTLLEGEQNLQYCHEAGIRTYINIIIGFPGETEEDFQLTMDYVRRNRDNIDWIILMAMFELFHHTEVVIKPELYQLRAADVEGLTENFGLVDWSDETGNTYEVRQYRFARMQRLLAELGLPDPTMQGDDMRLGLARKELIDHPAVHGMIGAALEVDPMLDIPLYEALEANLAHDDAKTRAGACRLLGMINARQSVPSLLEALTDRDEWVRGEAARALGRIADPMVLSHLHGILCDEGYAALSEDMQHNLARLRRVYLANEKVAAFEAKLADAQSAEG